MTNDQLLENQYAASMPLPALQISEGPEEALFSGQSPAGSAPIGTSFISGTGAAAPSTLSTFVPIIAIVVLAVMILGSKHRW
jgi:hypothetical protein